MQLLSDYHYYCFIIVLLYIRAFIVAYFSLTNECMVNPSCHKIVLVYCKTTLVIHTLMW